jgi:hypothetical protein
MDPDAAMIRMDKMAVGILRSWLRAIELLTRLVSSASFDLGLQRKTDVNPRFAITVGW